MTFLRGGAVFLASINTAMGITWAVQGRVWMTAAAALGVLMALTAWRVARR